MARTSLVAIAVMGLLGGSALAQSAAERKPAAPAGAPRPAGTLEVPKPDSAAWSGSIARYTPTITI